MTQEDLFKNLIAHTKEYGYIFPSSEIYDGLGNWGGLGKEVDGYHSTLTNIFTNEVIFEKNSMNKIESEELIRKDSLENSYFAHFFPIYAADRSILAYADKKVPMYVLQQLYYKLNNVNVNAQVLKKTK